MYLWRGGLNCSLNENHDLKLFEKIYVQPASSTSIALGAAILIF